MMSFDFFVLSIRGLIISGKVTVNMVIALLDEYGWMTTRDVPDDRRKWFLNSLESEGGGILY